MEPSLRLIPSYDTNVMSPLLQDLQEPLPPPPGSFPGMLRCPSSPSFQSLTVGLCKPGLEAAWGSLRAGLSPSCHRVPSRLKRRFLHKQADSMGRCLWLGTTQFMCFQHKPCFVSRVGFWEVGTPRPPPGVRSGGVSFFFPLSWQMPQYTWAQQLPTGHGGSLRARD